MQFEGAVGIMLGDAQIVVLIVLVERFLEALYAGFNTRRLLARGAREAGRGYYPVIVVAWLTWLAAIFLMVPAQTEIVWSLVGVYAVLQLGRWWVVATLGRRWTLRFVMTREATPVIAGPYRFLRHPHCTLVMLEIFILPLAFGAWKISVVMTAMMGAVIYYRIFLEESVREARRA